ncbi:alpha/beta hydrolase family protein [soil metagenome]
MFESLKGWNRREVLRIGGAPALALAMAQAWPASSALAWQDQEIQPLNRFPRMVHEAFVDRVRAIERRRVRVLAALESKADAEAYIASVQDKIRQAFGPLPEKTALNPQVTGVVDRDEYKIEKILFESRPGFLVSANLYVPKGREFPLPGVVGSCGHSANGKAAEPYQAFAQGLARLGYVTLIFDPIGQGERFQYPTEELRSRLGGGVREHLMAGNQQYLVGEFLGTWRAWDGIRALDYLLTRAEVDPEQVGITGNSGGGTLTTWLTGLEQRWSMSAPSCFVTSFRRNLENELPADTEQCPPRVLELGLDHEDFLAALAPKPVILLTKEKDYFDVRGSEDAFERLKRLYRLLGAEENIALFTGPTGHGYSQENREAMYAWFHRATGSNESSSEPELTIEEDETLWSSPNGQVCELESKTVQEFTRERSKQLQESRSKVSTENLPKAVSEFLDLRRINRRPDYRIQRPLRSRGYPRPHATPYVVETEPGIQAIVYRLYDESFVSRPPAEARRAILYISHHSADAELREEPLIKELIETEPDSAFYACDVRGIGDSQPDTCGVDTFLTPYGSDYFYAAHSIMLGRPYPAQRVRDVLTVLALLQSVGHREVHLVAKGWGTIPASFAALLSEAVTQVTLKQALTSYAEIAEAEHYDWPLSSFLPGVLEHFDLPDLYQALEAKKLRLVDPRGAKS